MADLDTTAARAEVDRLLAAMPEYAEPSARVARAIEQAATPAPMTLRRAASRSGAQGSPSRPINTSAAAILRKHGLG